MKFKTIKRELLLEQNDILQKGDTVFLDGSPFFTVDGWAGSPLSSVGESPEYTATRVIGEVKVPLTEDDLTTIIPSVNDNLTIKVRPAHTDRMTVLYQGDDLIMVENENLDALIEAIKLAGGVE